MVAYKRQVPTPTITYIAVLLPIYPIDHPPPLPNITSTSNMSRLFQPLRVGNIELQNRIVMAPLTRLRASDEHVPLPFVAEYYAQRASVPGTLLISEATLIAPAGAGLDNAPGIWNKDQIEAWKHVTDAVHKKGSFMYMQLWALGRAASAKSLEKDGFGKKVVSASDIPFEGGDKRKLTPMFIP